MWPFEACVVVDRSMRARAIALLRSPEYSFLNIVILYRGVVVRVDAGTLAEVARRIERDIIVLTNDPAERASGADGLYLFPHNLMVLNPAHPLDGHKGKSILVHETVHALQDMNRWPQGDPVCQWHGELAAFVVQIAYEARTRGKQAFDTRLGRALQDMVLDRSMHTGRRVVVTESELSTLPTVDSSSSSSTPSIQPSSDSDSTASSGPGRAPGSGAGAAAESHRAYLSKAGMYGKKLEERARQYGADPADYHPGANRAEVYACRRRPRGAFGRH